MNVVEKFLPPPSSSSFDILRWSPPSMLFYVINTEPDASIWQPIACFLLMIMVKLFTHRWNQSSKNNGIAHLKIAAQVLYLEEPGILPSGWHRELENRRKNQHKDKHWSTGSFQQGHCFETEMCKSWPPLPSRDTSEVLVVHFDNTAGLTRDRFYKRYPIS